MKRVVFIHYRTGERDGVSLEIEKRAKVFNALGYEVFYITGFDGLNHKNAFVVPELDIKNGEVIGLRQALFEGENEEIARKKYFRLEQICIEHFRKAFENIKPDLIFIHNVFSHAYNLPATTALLKALDKIEIPTVCVHHDFWFERDRFNKPRFLLVKNILDSFPPRRNYIIKHQVINSLALQELKNIRGIKAQQIGDYFDFSDKHEGHWKNQGIELKHKLEIGKNDLVILQATRVTARKGIENTLLFAKQLQNRLSDLSNTMVNGKLMNSNSKVIVLLPNFVEIDSGHYFEKLTALANKLCVNCAWAEDEFGPEKFDLFSSYGICDLVTYPSLKEGFGNQFLEAVFFRKLPIVFEYSVFKNDIKKEGYEYVSLGDKAYEKDSLNFVPEERINKAVNETMELLSNPNKLKEITDRNFEIGKKNHDKSLLLKDLKEVLKSI